MFRLRSLCTIHKSLISFIDILQYNGTKYHIYPICQFKVSVVNWASLRSVKVIVVIFDVFISNQLEAIYSESTILYPISNTDTT